MSISTFLNALLSLTKVRLLYAMKEAIKHVEYEHVNLHVCSFGA